MPEYLWADNILSLLPNTTLDSQDFEKDCFQKWFVINHKDVAFHNYVLLKSVIMKATTWLLIYYSYCYSALTHTFSIAFHVSTIQAAGFCPVYFRFGVWLISLQRYIVTLHYYFDIKRCVCTINSPLLSQTELMTNRTTLEKGLVSWNDMLPIFLWKQSAGK